MVSGQVPTLTEDCNVKLAAFKAQLSEAVPPAVVNSV